MRAPSQRKIALALFVTGVFVVGPVFGDKPDWAGHGKSDKGAQDSRGDDRYRRDDRRGDVRGGLHFDDHQRAVVREYYADSFRHGRCPPGLAKKHNGCMPPGQARKWQLGRPLPRDVVYYDLPPRVVVSLGVPPAGHKYVRVAGDILLIAIGTGVVVDAIDDLGGR
ncbi:MAG: RcnB family protein [Hyphomicrobiaceae bacterium]